MVKDCTACKLSRTRTQTVFGVGPQDAPLMIIGEGPGADEDARGEPFVGRAGQLLDQMLKSIGRSRQQSDAGSAVFIEIGRASCRERVCQYREIRGVCVYIKK